MYLDVHGCVFLCVCVYDLYFEQTSSGGREDAVVIRHTSREHVIVDAFKLGCCRRRQSKAGAKRRTTYIYCVGVCVRERTSLWKLEWVGVRNS